MHALCKEVDTGCNMRGNLSEKPCTLLRHAVLYKEAGNWCHGQMQPL